MNIAYFLLAVSVTFFCFQVYQSRRRRPVAEFGKGQVQMALRYSREHQADVERRGSISRHELTRLLRLNLKRVDAELQRRAAAD